MTFPVAPLSHLAVEAALRRQPGDSRITKPSNDFPGGIENGCASSRIWKSMVRSGFPSTRETQPFGTSTLITFPQKSRLKACRWRAGARKQQRRQQESHTPHFSIIGEAADLRSAHDGYGPAVRRRSGGSHELWRDPP